VALTRENYREINAHEKRHTHTHIFYFWMRKEGEKYNILKGTSMGTR
jgi:hypothetical protein